MRVTLVIYSLRGGGAERVMSIMANHWAECGWKVTLLTYDDGAEAPAYRLSAAVDHRHLGIEGASSGVVQAVKSNVRRLVVLRRAIRDSAPDAVISFLDVVNVRTILATFGLGVPVVVSEHSDPSRHRIGAVWQALRKWSYRYAASVVVLTPDALRYFPNAIRRKGAVIPNPLEVDVGADLVPVGGRRKTVVSVGRLAEEKGFDRLITAFSMVAAKHREWSLTIWGEGEDRQSLEAVRDRLGLRGRVALPGWTRAPFKELSVAGLFVMSSRYEGFSNALCEAMACGAPVVSFDCQGPRHIVRDGHDGVLVPEGDVDKLAAAMDRLMADPAERDRLAANGVKVIERFRRTTPGTHPAGRAACAPRLPALRPGTSIARPAHPRLRLARLAPLSIAPFGARRWSAPLSTAHRYVTGADSSAAARGAPVLRRRGEVRNESPVVVMMCAWWPRRYSSAVVSFSTLNVLTHSPNASFTRRSNQRIAPGSPT